MSLLLITDPNASPIFVLPSPEFTCEAEQAIAVQQLPIAHISEVNAILDAYGFEPSSYAHGDPRRLIQDQSQGEYLAFFNGELGFISELPLAYLASDSSPCDSQHLTDSAIRELAQKVIDNFDSERGHTLKSFERGTFFLTYHHRNYDNGLCFNSFIPLVSDGVIYSSPYPSATALQDLTSAAYDFVIHSIT